MTINRKRCNFVQFNVGFYLELLGKIDDMAKELGISRAAFIRNTMAKEVGCQLENPVSRRASARG